MTELYLVEYNARQRAPHFERLDKRLERNAAELLSLGHEASPGWVPVAIVDGYEQAAQAAADFAEKMLARWA